jgi:hypothetical protein
LAAPTGVCNGSPEPEDCRAALARVLASPLFQGSPKLAAFLRFVVEEKLAGQSERIKGYTIGIEALGRGQNFDPQADPIVRVEAGRLRRTLDAYYVGAGIDDPMVITLPVGSYVPIFALRKSAAPALAAPVLEAPAPIEPGTPWWRRRPRMSVAAALVALAAPGAVWALVTHVQHDPGLAGAIDRSAADPSAARESARLPAASTLPLIAVEPIATVGAARTQFDAEVLRQKVQSALARFDDVRVEVEPLPPAGAGVPRERAADYRLAATFDARDADEPQLSYRLIDSVDRAVVWSKTYRNFGAGGDHAGGHVPARSDVGPGGARRRHPAERAPQARRRRRHRPALFLPARRVRLLAPLPGRDARTRPRLSGAIDRH